MKISEIISETPLDDLDSRSADQYHHLLATKGMSPNTYGHERLGSGAEAVVFKDPAEPSVIKIMGSEVSLKQNATLQYLFQCKKYAAENPYLPRIHSINQVDNPHPGKPILSMRNSQSEFLTEKIYVIKMEELIELFDNRISDDMLPILWADIFIDPAPQNLHVQMFADAVADYFLGTPKFRPKKNKNLTAVINLVKLIRRKTNAYFDLHENNMMVRISTFGPQLVITDPVTN